MHLNIALCWAAVHPAAGEQVIRGDEGNDTSAKREKGKVKL